MTLKEACIAAADDYDREIANMTELKNSQLGKLIEEQYKEIEASKVLEEIMAGCLRRGFLDVSAVAMLAFRAGMRTQRKYDRPGEVTTVDYRWQQPQPAGPVQ